MQTSSGAVACQLLDALQPGVVNMNKVIPQCSSLDWPEIFLLLTYPSYCAVLQDPAIERRASWRLQVDFNAATEYDAVNNYKVLQAAFTKMGIDKAGHVPLPACSPT